MANDTKIILNAEDKTQAAFSSVQNSLQTLKAAMGPLAASFSALGMLNLVKGTIDANDQLYKLSQKTGIATEALSVLKYAGDLSGVGIQDLATGFKKLAVNMTEAAATGKGKAAEAFKALGVSVVDANGNLRASDVVMANVADRFAGMEDGAGKAALAVAIFGKAGDALIPLLNGGAAGLKKAREEAEQFGLIVGGDVAKASEEFNDNLHRLTLGSEAFGKSVVKDMIGPLGDFVEALLEGRKIAGGFWEAERLFAFNLDAMTAEKPGQEIKRLTKKLEEYQALSKVEQSFRDAPGTQPGSRGSDLEKQITFLKYLQRRGALADAAALGDNRDARDLQLLPGPKTKAPLIGGQDNANSEQAWLSGLRNQINAANGDLSEYSKILEAISAGSAKDFSRATKDSALALAKEIDMAKASAQAHELRANILKKIDSADEGARKAVNDYRFKQDQAVEDIGVRTSELGKTPYEIQQLQSIRRVEKEYQESAKKIYEELAKIGDIEMPDEEQYRRIEGIYKRLGDLKRERDSAMPATLHALAQEKTARDELNASWEFGGAEALRKYGDEVANVSQFTEDAMSRAYHGMEDTLTGFFTTGKLGWRSLTESILGDLARIEVRQRIMQPFAAAGGFGGLANLLGFGSGSNTANNNHATSWSPDAWDLFGGYRAAGGPVAPYTDYIVGEHGPERLRMGSQGGTVIPNGAVAPSVTVHLNISTGVQQTVRAEMANMLPAITQAVTAGVVESRQRGGGMGHAF